MEKVSVSPGDHSAEELPLPAHSILSQGSYLLPCGFLIAVWEKDEETQLFRFSRTKEVRNPLSSLGPNPSPTPRPAQALTVPRNSEQITLCNKKPSESRTLCSPTSSLHAPTSFPIPSRIPLPFDSDPVCANVLPPANMFKNKPEKASRCSVCIVVFLGASLQRLIHNTQLPERKKKNPAGHQVLPQGAVDEPSIRTAAQPIHHRGTLFNTCHPNQLLHYHG